jgi:hypothetical protein
MLLMYNLSSVTLWAVCLFENYLSDFNQLLFIFTTSPVYSDNTYSISIRKIFPLKCWLGLLTVASSGRNIYLLNFTY